MAVLKISNRAFNGNIDCFQNLADISDFFSFDDVSVLDLGGLVELNPFNMLVLALSIRKWKRFWGKLSYILPNSDNTDGYMQYMEFYELCGFSNRGIIKGNRRVGKYICITKIDLIPQGSMDADYEMIDQESKKLADMFQFDKELGKYITYCFFEMIRNVYEHSESKSVYVCAQFWPSHNLVELAIADEGCGIWKAMQKQYANITEEQSMEFAMTPGISARTNHILLPKDDYYKNSGYGLYMTKELALAYGGSFIICSGKSAIRYSFKSEDKFQTDFSGTAISIRFKTDRDNNFSDVLTKIKSKAEKKSRKYEDAIHTASKSSGGSRK